MRVSGLFLRETKMDILGRKAEKSERLELRREGRNG